MDGSRVSRFISEKQLQNGLCQNMVDVRHLARNETRWLTLTCVRTARGSSLSRSSSYPHSGLCFTQSLQTRFVAISSVQFLTISFQKNYYLFSASYNHIFLKTLPLHYKSQPHLLKNITFSVQVVTTYFLKQLLRRHS